MGELQAVASSALQALLLVGRAWKRSLIVWEFWYSRSGDASAYRSKLAVTGA
jgi:hypothetical protein